MGLENFGSKVNEQPKTKEIKEILMPDALDHFTGTTMKKQGNNFISHINSYQNNWNDMSNLVNEVADYYMPLKNGQEKSQRIIDSTKFKELQNELELKGLVVYSKGYELTIINPSTRCCAIFNGAKDYLDGFIIPEGGDFGNAFKEKYNNLMRPKGFSTKQNYSENDIKNINNTITKYISNQLNKLN